MNRMEIYRNKYVPFVIKWGRRTNLLGVILLFVPCIVITLSGYSPIWGAVGASMIMRLSSLGLNYVVEPVSYYPGLGLAGTYMSYLAGNINNMRLPCAICAQEAAGVEPGTPEGNCIATVGIAVSIVVNLIILSLTIIFGTAIVSALPAEVKSTLNYLVPALFGSLIAGLIIKNWKYASVCLPLAIVMTCLNKYGAMAFLPSAFRTPIVMLISIFGSVALGMSFFTDRSAKK
ncbi:MAG: hypothetical protein LUC99_07120 [Clostridiales bacterium]|nr:hypothetical protein [Clostridiales bacterium]